MSQFSGQSLNNGNRRFMIEWNNAISRHNLAKKMAEFLRKDLWCNWPFVSLDDKTMASLKIFEIIRKNPVAFLNIFYLYFLFIYFFWLFYDWVMWREEDGLTKRRFWKDDSGELWLHCILRVDSEFFRKQVSGCRRA